MRTEQQIKADLAAAIRRLKQAGFKVKRNNLNYKEYEVYKRGVVDRTYHINNIEEAATTLAPQST